MRVAALMTLLIIALFAASANAQTDPAVPTTLRPLATAR